MANAAAAADGGGGGDAQTAMDFGFWTSIVQCKNPAAKPRLTFNRVMRCGCAAGGSYAGPCVDDGNEVLGLPAQEVLKIDKELQAPSPPFNGNCQQLPQVFLDSGTADSGANFDELWDAAMNSPCATDPNLEWMGRDCRDSFIPGKGAEGDPAVQDRSDPNKPCTLECATLYLKIAELCPRVYQLLRLDQLAPICPELQSVTVQPLAGAPVPIDGSYVVAGAPAPAVVVPAPVPIAEVPVVAPIPMPVPVPTVLPPQVVVTVAPAPAPAQAPSSSAMAAHIVACISSWMALVMTLI